MQRLDNLKVRNFKRLVSPRSLRVDLPVSDRVSSTIAKGRSDFIEILNGNDDRFVVVIGPCSIHDYDAAIEYATKLKGLSDKLSDKILVLMRVYFEKPRTTVGWKGLINDPHLDGSHDLESGLRLARKILIDIAEIGLPSATELLDPIIAAYLAELVSWVAIGARTTESQTHREMASGLSSPVGFKNNSDGNLDVAINAMQSSFSPHYFLGIDDEGFSSIVETQGNSNCHLILRGGKSKPNYDYESIIECRDQLLSKNFDPKIMVDISHENSGKDYRNQSVVLRDVITQIKSGDSPIFGIMAESNLFEGSQQMSSNLAYGVSITDSCIGYEETEDLLHELYASLT